MQRNENMKKKSIILWTATVSKPQIILLSQLFKSTFNARGFVGIVLQVIVAIIYPQHL